MTCARCAELEAEVTSLRQELAYEVDQALVDNLRQTHRLTGQEATLVAALCRANGRVLSKAALAALLPKQSGAERESDSIVCCFVMRARIRLGDAAIETVRGRGYRASNALRHTFANRSVGAAA